MSSLDYLELCRLCLVKDNVSLPIFEDEGDERQIYFKISSCLPVKVLREDKLPKKICDECGYKVELLYQFWNTSVNAEKQLLQWLGEVGGLEEKQDFVTAVLDPSALKQDRSGNTRLDGNVLQVSGQGNIDINMIDNMSIITIPAGSEQQFTTVPMDTSVVQAVAGPSTQVTHEQLVQSQADVSQIVGEESEEDNYDDGCDNDDGMTVKEETEEDHNEQSTFANVSLPCDEAGPSGLQQSELTAQTADGDPKSGSSSRRSSGRGIFIFERESLVMRKWQILEFDGKPYYAFVPEDDEPIKEEAIPELPEDEVVIAEASNVHDEKLDAVCSDEEQLMEEPADKQPSPGPIGNLYQVKVEGNVVTLEKLNVQPIVTNVCQPVETVAEPDTTIADDDEQFEAEDEEEEERLEDDDGEEEYQPANSEDEEEEEEEDEYDADEFVADEEKKPAKTGRLKCKVCSETFNSTVGFKKHVAWTHKRKVCVQENGLYICSVCDYRTAKKSLFRSHLESKHETWSSRRAGSSGAGSSSSLFPCAACGFVCRSKHSLQSHFIRKHTDRYEHQCMFCPKKFKVKGDLTNHVRFHHKEKPVSCDVCGKVCLNSGSLYVHQKWAHYKPKYECPVCHRRMVSQENLDQHMVMQHEKREKIVCAECGKTFTKKDSFKRHMAVHTGSKPYGCVICSKPFARRSQLRQHLLIHTGKRPFVCDICGKAFTQKPGLICHRKTHPGTHPPLPVMPIGDIVKEFTEGFLAGSNSVKIESLDVGTADEEIDENEEQDDGEILQDQVVEIVEEEDVLADAVEQEG